MTARSADSIALTEAVSVNPRVVGSASGLYGFMQMAVGAQPQSAILRSIELFGSVVAPAVRAALAKRKVPA